MASWQNCLAPKFRNKTEKCPNLAQKTSRLNDNTVDNLLAFKSYVANNLILFFSQIFLQFSIKP